MKEKDDGAKVVFIFNDKIEKTYIIPIYLYYLSYKNKTKVKELRYLFYLIHNENWTFATYCWNTIKIA